MKTAVSVPDELFKRAERTAKRLRISRSELYATALAEFLERRDSEAITRELNAVYTNTRAKLDQPLHVAQLRSIDADSW